MLTRFSIDLAGLRPPLVSGFFSCEIKTTVADSFVGNFPSKVENLKLARFPAISSSRLTLSGFESSPIELP
jgi:hypothetical protein